MDWDEAKLQCLTDAERNELLTLLQKMLAAPVHAPNLKGIIENYDRALSHPDKNDLIQLKKAVME